jgi:hypothetical protein
MKPSQTLSKESTQEWERKRNKEQGSKSRQAKEPQRGEPHGGKETTKSQNLHQSHEAYQLKNKELGPIKLQA